MPKKKSVFKDKRSPNSRRQTNEREAAKTNPQICRIRRRNAKGSTETFVDIEAKNIKQQLKLVYNKSYIRIETNIQLESPWIINSFTTCTNEVLSLSRKRAHPFLYNRTLYITPNPFSSQV